MKTIFRRTTWYNRSTSWSREHSDGMSLNWSHGSIKCRCWNRNCYYSWAWDIRGRRSFGEEMGGLVPVRSVYENNI